jgi:hypothetical protein
MLPDLALLELFNFYVNKVGPIEKWHTLVHVCRRRRNVVFRSPRRLGLELSCTSRNRVREMLDVWPPSPIVIRRGCYPTDNIAAALRHTDRVCEIKLWSVPSSQWENVLLAMERPFPELTDLKLRSKDETAPVVPDSFLGGFAPRLRSLRFGHFRDYRTFFRLPPALSRLPFRKFLIPGIFHPKRWSLVSPRCPGSQNSSSYSCPLHLSPTGKDDVRLLPHVPSYQLSGILGL